MNHASYRAALFKDRFETWAVRLALVLVLGAAAAAMRGVAL